MAEHRTVLVAEDNAIAGRVIEHLLTDRGFSVLRADNGEDALRLARQQRPDLLLTDILMPRMDGFGLCREFKRDAQLASVPVVFYSSTFTSPEDRRLAEALGAARFMIKSAGNAELLRAVDEALDEDETGKAAPVIDAEVERLYNERLVAKLNMKVQQLEESEERFLHVLSLMPDVLFTISVPDFAPTFASNAVSRMFGFSPHEVIADPHLWRHQLLDEDLPAVLDKLQFVVDHCAPAKVEARFRNRNGEAIIYTEIRYAPSCDGQGKVNSIIGVMTDITARKLAEMETEESHRRLDTLMGNLPGMAYRCRNERDWEMEFVSDGVRALTGYEPQELIGNTLIAYNDLILVEDQAAVWNEVQASLAKGHEFECIYRIRCRDGEVRWVWEKGAGVYDRKGGLLALEGFVTDITVRRQAEDSVRELARFPEQNPSPMMRIAADGKVLYANEAASNLLREVGEAHRVPEQWRELCGAMLRDGASSGFEQQTGTRHYSLLVSPVVDSGYCNFYGLDVTERKEAETGLRKLNRALRTLSVCNESLVRAVNEEELLQRVCDALVTIGGYRMVWVGYIEHDAAQTVRPMAWAGSDDGLLQQAHFGWGTDARGKGVTGTAIRLNQPIVMPDLAAPDYDFPYRDAELNGGYRSSIGLPLVSGGKVIGALTLFSAQTNAVDEEELALLEQLAGDLGFGIGALRLEQSNTRNAERVQRALLETIRSISMTIEKRDPYTAGHQQRVAELAAAIATEMALAPDRVEGIRMGSMVHDIGKIYVPSEILNRPGRLNPVEFGIIQSHPQVGYDIIKDVEFPWPVADMILQHHERLDGTGYPQGLQGEEITEEARILAVADVVEAMASHRPYRAGLGLGVALQEIEQGRGTLYDEAVVDSCLRLFRERGYVLEE